MAKIGRFYLTLRTSERTGNQYTSIRFVPDNAITRDDSGKATSIDDTKCITVDGGLPGVDPVKDFYDTDREGNPLADSDGNPMKRSVRFSVEGRLVKRTDDNGEHINLAVEKLSRVAMFGADFWGNHASVKAKPEKAQKVAEMKKKTQKVAIPDDPF